MAVKRTITELNGIKLSDGLHIPNGICVAAPVYCYHLDPDFYPDRPDTYDAFRFSRPVEEAGSTGDSKDSATQQEASKPISLPITATKVEFLPFGLGKHAAVVGPHSSEL
jgi:cytochrome P450